MSAKEEKPTLAGVSVKTRKRDVVAPVDPGTFADAVTAILQDTCEGVSIDADLEAIGKALDSTDLEYSKYGETLFEVLFVGGRLTTGGNIAEDKTIKATSGKPILHVLAVPANRESILPFIKVFQLLGRRRPYLYNRLEKTIVKLLLSLEFFKEDENRVKIAIALALVFSLKLNVLPENVFAALLNDRLVAKGTVRDLVTAFFQEYLSKDTMDDLVQILYKGRVMHRLEDFFPPTQRSTQDFTLWFKEKNLDSLMEWNMRRQEDIKIAELQEQLEEMMTADPPSSAAEIVSLAKARQQEFSLPEAELLRVVWLSAMRPINLTGKSTQQIGQAMQRQIKMYSNLLSTFATSGKLELSLLVTIQVFCYEDTRLLKIFSDVVRILYDMDIVGEGAVTHWYKKGSHSKGRNVFLKDMEPFIKWLEEAEEDDDEDEA